MARIKDLLRRRWPEIVWAVVVLALVGWMVRVAVSDWPPIPSSPPTIDWPPLPPPRPLPVPVPIPSDTVRGLSEAGRAFPGARVCESDPIPLLQELATGQARYQAGVRRQGHQDFDRRYARVRSELGLSAAEICAESWSWQTDLSPRRLGDEMFKCWRQSPGHWAVASRVHKGYGADMAKGSNGVWYATILVGD